MIDSRVRMRPSTNACSLRASSYSGVFWAPTISLASCMRWATAARRTLIILSSSFCSLASPSLVRGTDLPGMAITPRPCEKRDWGRVYPQSSRCSRRFRRYYRAAPAACKEGELAGFAEKGGCVKIRVAFLGVVILLVFPPSGAFGGGDGDGTTAGDGSGINATQGEMPALPPGLVALSNFVEFDTDGDQDATIALPLRSRPEDEATLGFYTYLDGRWQRAAAARPGSGRPRGGGGLSP